MRQPFLLLALTAGTCLMGQGVRINGGAQVGVAAPTGDFATKETWQGDYLGANGGFGLHFGGHLDLNFNAHHQLRLHGTVHGFASSEQNIYSSNGYYDGTLQNGFGVAQAGGDYVYNLVSPSKGLYFLAGLNLNKVTLTAKYSDFEDLDISQSGRVGLRIGAGYTFNRVFSLEGQINSISVEANGRDGFGYNDISWVSVSAVFRFGRR